MKAINIKYPFQNSKKGFFLELNGEDNQAIKSDLLHLILTNKGERYYNPNFGTNLLKFIFEPNDSLTLAAINAEIKETVKLYFPTLTINNIDVTQNTQSEYAATITINYTITDAVYETTEILVVNV